MKGVDKPHIAKKPAKKGPATKKQRIKREQRRLYQARIEGNQR